MKSESKLRWKVVAEENYVGLDWLTASGATHDSLITYCLLQSLKIIFLLAGSTGGTSVSTVRLYNLSHVYACLLLQIVDVLSQVLPE